MILNSKIDLLSLCRGTINMNPQTEEKLKKLFKDMTYSYRIEALSFDSSYGITQGVMNAVDEQIEVWNKKLDVILKESLIDYLPT